MRKQKKRKSNSILVYVVVVCVCIVLITLSYYFFNKKFNSSKESIQYDKQDYPHLNVFEVHGIDISKHNGDLEWSEISKHSINDWELKFVFVRATVALADGKLKEDNQFDENWSQASNNSLIKGAYHFYSPAVDVNEQADLFINEVHLSKGDLPPVLDVENFERGNVFISKKDIPKVLKWLQIIENNYGVKPIIYTSKKMYIDYFKNKQFSNYHFWIANYGESLTDIDKSEWTFWQHSEEGKINGHKCCFDLNVFNGTESELEKLCIQ